MKKDRKLDPNLACLLLILLGLAQFLAGYFEILKVRNIPQGLMVIGIGLLGLFLNRKEKK